MPITRRKLIQSGLLGATAFLAPSGLPGTARAAGGEKVLVAVFLRGGADGLSVVIPQGDGRLAELRPSLLEEPGSEIGLDGFYAFHPALAPLLPLFQQGQLDVVHAVGNPLCMRSHFDEQSFIERASPGDKSIRDGWLNRYLAQIGAANPVSGVSLSHRASVSLSGPAPRIAFPSLDTFRILSPREDERRAALERRYLPIADTVLGRSVIDALDATDLMGAIPTNTSVSYPRGRFGAALEHAAALIRADIGVRVVTIDLGGWDTHSGQKRLLAGLLAELSAGLAAFHQDLGSHTDRTLLLAMTEFGRTVRQNGAFGSDHGRASFMLGLGGGSSRGRVLTANGWPGLADEDLYQGRDLAVTTDFRDVFAEVLDRHLGLVDVDSIFPDFATDPARYPGLFS